MDEESEFSVEQADEESILVRHSADSHRYAFFIVAEAGRRALGDSVTIGNTASASDGADFAGSARLFAETEARARNLID